MTSPRLKHSGNGVDFQREGPVATPQGDSSWHLVATLGFATMDALQAAFASPEGQRAAADLANPGAWAIEWTAVPATR